MALRTSRIWVLRGRPPVRGAGISGSRTAHWTSVRSVGYRWRFIFHYTEFTPFGTDSYCVQEPNRSAERRSYQKLMRQVGSTAQRINLLIRRVRADIGAKQPDFGPVVPEKLSV